MYVYFYYLHLRTEVMIGLGIERFCLVNIADSQSSLSMRSYECFGFKEKSWAFTISFSFCWELNTVIHLY